MNGFVHYATDVKDVNYMSTATLVRSEKGCINLPPIVKDVEPLFAIDENGLWVQPKLLIETLQSMFDLVEYQLYECRRMSNVLDEQYKQLAYEIYCASDE